MLRNNLFKTKVIREEHRKKVVRILYYFAYFYLITEI